MQKTSYVYSWRAHDKSDPLSQITHLYLSARLRSSWPVVVRFRTGITPVASLLSPQSGKSGGRGMQRSTLSHQATHRREARRGCKGVAGKSRSHLSLRAANGGEAIPYFSERECLNAIGLHLSRRWLRARSALAMTYSSFPLSLSCWGRGTCPHPQPLSHWRGRGADCLHYCQFPHHLLQLVRERGTAAFCRVDRPFRAGFFSQQ